MYRSFIKKHIISLSILLFILGFYLLQQLAPSFLYKKNGHIRQFGIGYKKKTIIPIWLVALVLAILSYVTIRYLSESAKINF